MANFDSINLLPRQVAVNYLKLKSDASKVQRTASSIECICKSFFISYSTSVVYFIFFLQSYLSLFSYLQLNLPYFLTISEKLWCFFKLHLCYCNCNLFSRKALLIQLLFRITVLVK